MKTKADKAERFSERRTNGNAVARQPTAQRRPVGPTGSKGVAFRDNRGVAVAQRKLQQSIDDSPRQLAQAEQLSGAFGLPVQRVEDEEELQMMADPATAQREAIEEEDLLQGRFDSGAPPVQLEAGAEESQNRTGMPDPLKSGLERLSGMDLSDVRVHANSPKPAQLNALAYAQGNDIHVGPGQEKHVPHEAWHVVQQAQGRVRPTMQMAGVQINDDEGLEREADVMGERAVGGAQVTTGVP